MLQACMGASAVMHGEDENMEMQRFMVHAHGHESVTSGRSKAAECDRVPGSLGACPPSIYRMCLHALHGLDWITVSRPAGHFSQH